MANDKAWEIALKRDVIKPLEAVNDIFERETIIAKLAAKAREKSMAEGSLNYNINKPYSSSYEAGYRDALSRLWSDAEDVIRTLARL